ncbi:MAG TPA: HAD family hydrolase [Acidobacteriota bacterium]|nr:HAD family hydrolase [Acidobacteriota bacterium]
MDGNSHHRAILFDFDGTLIDASDAIVSAFNLTLRDLGIAEMEHKSVVRLIGRPLQEMFFEVMGRRPQAEEVESILDIYREHFYPIATSHARPLPGLAETLTYYSGRIKLGIATSRHSRGAYQILEHFGLRSHFGAVVGLDHVNQAKPHPEPLLQALRQLETEPAQAVMVGDTTDDMAAARAARVLAVGITTGSHSRRELKAAGAHHIITSLPALRSIVA